MLDQGFVGIFLVGTIISFVVMLPSAIKWKYAPLLFLFFIFSDFLVITWLCLAVNSPNQIALTEELDVKTHDNIQLIIYKKGGAICFLNVNSYFGRIIPEGTKIKRIVWEKTYFGVHFQHLEKDSFEIIEKK